MKNKNAILLVSFGTRYLDSKQKTIDKIAAKITTSFPDYKIYQAWTSKVIINILKEKNHLYIPTLEEAMKEIVKDGVETLFVQPTHLIHGLENEVMTETILKYAPNTLKVSFGLPLLSSTKDQRDALQAIINEFCDLPKDEALVLMGHGTAHYVNSVYAALDYMLKDMGYSNLFMGTVEAYPNLETLIRQVAKINPKKIHLAPFMLVAGDHANHDLAGDNKDSWKSLFETAGYKVECHLKGLGEYEEIQEIYLEHLKEAMKKAK